jgi:hypothetical protein
MGHGNSGDREVGSKVIERRISAMLSTAKERFWPALDYEGIRLISEAAAHADKALFDSTKSATDWKSYGCKPPR